MVAAISSALTALASKTPGKAGLSFRVSDPVPYRVSPSLQTIVEIQSSSVTGPGSTAKGTLQAILKVVSESKGYFAVSGEGSLVCNLGEMRFFSGYDPKNPDQVWPWTSRIPAPGPTLRARFGDTVQITFLNQVNVNDFPNTIDVAEMGQACDQVITFGIGNTYPGTFDRPPNCLHASSSTSLHFHGAHISPGPTGDNTLINVRPSPRVDGRPVANEQFVKSDFAKIFAAGAQGRPPQKWEDLPLSWRRKQQQLLEMYDLTMPWQGLRGLPPEERLWTKDQKAIHSGQWPQYYIGAYPICFQIPLWNGRSTSMGQAPGTHWYHAHHHGSTALNLANGMAGAFIIEGPYDDTLRRFFAKQVVLLLQQFSAVSNLLRAQRKLDHLTPDLVFVNGQYTPILQMKPNEMQLWRIVNACHENAVSLDRPTNLKWVQTAQDGVQFDPRNYNPKVTNNQISVPAVAKPLGGSLAPGNRIDLLVQAPGVPGTYQVTFGGGTVLLTVEVRQDPLAPSIASPMRFPTQSEFPAIPEFLADINPDQVTVKRELHFLSTPPKTPLNPSYPPPTHTINGKQFDGTIDQTIVLGATEEWTIYNDSPGAAHPFHIQINPFQVVEILDPAVSKDPVMLPAPWVWWDTFAIPPAAVPPGSTDGKHVSGYFKMRTRFVDFTGVYLLYSHILENQDRGMMQLVQVVTNTA